MVFAKPTNNAGGIAVYGKLLQRARMAPSLIRPLQDRGSDARGHDQCASEQSQVFEWHGDASTGKVGRVVARAAAAANVTICCTNRSISEPLTFLP